MTITTLMSSYKKPFLFLILSLLIFLPFTNIFAAESVCETKYPCEQAGVACCPRSGSNSQGAYMQCENRETAECIKPGLVPCGNPGQPDCTICDIFVLAQNIINFVLIDIVPAAAALMAAVAGILYLFGGAMPKWRALGKKLIKQVVYGLIIIYISFIILNTILALVAPESKKYFSVTEGGVKIQCLYPK